MTMTLSRTNVDNDVTESCLVGHSGSYRPDIKNAVCQLFTHVGTATTRDEINIKRLLRYLIGNPACNMIVGCNLDVPGTAGTPQCSVVVIGLETSKIVATTLESQFGSGVLLKTRGIQCLRLPRNRTWFA